MKKRILICGDSWTRSWFKSNFTSEALQSRNFIGPVPKENFFKDMDPRVAFNKNSFQTAVIALTALGFDVVDISVPGSSNYGQLEQLKSYYEAYNDNDFDYILVYQSAPCRDISSARLAKPKDCGDVYKPVSYFNGSIIEYGMHLMSPDLFDETVDQFLMNFYMGLDHIQRTCYPNSNILLLGGAGSLRSDLINSLKNQNLGIVCESITELLIEKFINDHKPFEENEMMMLSKFKQHPEITFAGWIHLIDERWNPDLVNYIYEKWDEKGKIMATEFRGYFYPDFVHPGSDSIILTLDYVFKYIEDLENENGP